MSYMLDTNVIIDIIRKKRVEVLNRLSKIPNDQIFVSVIVYAELEYGASKSSDPEKNRRLVDQFLSPFSIVDYSVEAASAYGEIRNELERKGILIGPYDMLIASHAVALGAVMVTNNVKEYSRIPFITVQNWRKI